jgi:tellurium resistance protein TerD
MPQMNVSPMLIPQLIHQVQKGQKQSLTGQNLQILDVCLGWNVTNPACDVDVSAFLLDETGKVPGDNWFVFYGQTESPDGSVRFSAQSQNDREEISIHLQQLHPSVKKIVFVLTINDAFEQKRNFSMIRDAYIRIMDHTSKQEIISFKMDEYYQNVISMMIGELYLYNGIWKFHAIGNGVAKDLAGLCQLYGVSVV